MYLFFTSTSCMVASNSTQKTEKELKRRLVSYSGRISTDITSFFSNKEKNVRATCSSSIMKLNTTSYSGFAKVMAFLELFVDA